MSTSLDQTKLTTFSDNMSFFNSPLSKEMILSDLQSLYIFKRDSKLPTLIIPGTKADQMIFSLGELIILVKAYVHNWRLNDPQNTEIIICNDDLKLALGIEILHTCQVREVLLEQMYKLEPQIKKISHVTDVIIKNDDNISKFFASGEHTDFLNGIIEGSVTHRNRRMPPKDMHFCLSKDLHTILKTTDLSGEMLGKEEFTHQEAMSLLQRYVATKKLTTSENEDIAILRDDPLQKIFKINAFHKIQMISLLNQQLIPSSVFKSDPGSDSMENMGNLKVSIEPTNLYSSPPQQGSSSLNDDTCIMCCGNLKNGAFIHGQSAHTIGCYECSMSIWLRGSNCPICNITVERVILLFKP